MTLGIGPFGASGTTLYLGTTATTAATDSFTQIGSLESIGQYGINFAEVTFEDLSLGEEFSYKGKRADGSIPIGLGWDVSDSGQAAMLAAVLAKDDYNFKVQYNDAVPAVAVTGVSITAASPGVVTDTAHGLAANTPVKFTAGAGTLPTGIVDGTTYYVKTVLSSGTYTLSATAGGTVINTTGSPSGTYTRTTVPAATYDLFKAKVMSFQVNPGSLSTVVKAVVNLKLKPGTLATTNRTPTGT